jgi:hypothetical protein
VSEGKSACVYKYGNSIWFCLMFQEFLGFDGVDVFYDIGESLSLCLTLGVCVIYSILPFLMFQDSFYTCREFKIHIYILIQEYSDPACFIGVDG